MQRQPRRHDTQQRLQRLQRPTRLHLLVQRENPSAPAHCYQRATATRRSALSAATALMHLRPATVDAARPVQRPLQRYTGRRWGARGGQSGVSAASLPPQQRQRHRPSQRSALKATARDPAAAGAAAAAPTRMAAEGSKRLHSDVVGWRRPGLHLQTQRSESSESQRCDQRQLCRSVELQPQLQAEATHVTSATNAASQQAAVRAAQLGQQAGVTAAHQQRRPGRCRSAVI